MNAVKTFIDTNVLIYAFTADDPLKQETALKALENCFPVISTQVIKELSNVMLKKSIALQTIREIISDITEAAEVKNEELGLIFVAFDIYERYKFSFYDSLITAAAINSKCRVLLSEDMQNGQIINDKLKIINPFDMSPTSCRSIYLHQRLDS